LDRLNRAVIPFGVGLLIIVVPYIAPIFTVPIYALYKFAVFSELVDPSSFFRFWQIANFLLPTFILVVLVRLWEQETWSSIGFTKLSLADPFLGVALFLIICLVTLPPEESRLSLAGLKHELFPNDFWFLAIIASGVLFEEVASRAYVIERVTKLTGSRALAGIVSLCIAIGLHLHGRNLNAALSRSPALFLLTMLYLWRRNVVPCMIAHFLLDASVLLMVSSAGWLAEWTLSPTPLCLALASLLLLYLITRYLTLNRRTSVSSAPMRFLP
jgi:membrane protease YdiL (CAAX protease family)